MPSMPDFAERLIAPISNLELERRWSAVRAAMANDSAQLKRLNEFAARVQSKLDELQTTVDTRRKEGLQAALEIVKDYPLLKVALTDPGAVVAEALAELEQLEGVLQPGVRVVVLEVAGGQEGQGPDRHETDRMSS